MTRKKHGIPSQPENLYRSLVRNMVDKGMASILLAVFESKVVAGAILLKMANTVYYKYSASNPDVLSRISPNHLLAWTAIEGACFQGFQYFDFGRCAPDNEGLMRYKRMWGTQEKVLAYAFYPRSSGASMRSEHGRAIEILKWLWRLLPNPLIELVGPKLLKYFG
jgi:CelD/BcsL family acetyltransferase involved in cellulose biosynthesis